MVFFHPKYITHITSNNTIKGKQRQPTPRRNQRQNQGKPTVNGDPEDRQTGETSATPVTITTPTSHTTQLFDICETLARLWPVAGLY